MTALSPAMDALYHGDYDKAERLLSDEPDLFEAAAFGRADRLKQILAADGRAAEGRASDDFTALHLAAFFGHPEPAKALIEAGADVNSVATNSFVERVQPLHSAAANRNHDCSRLLLDAGADVNAQQGDGFTPLMAAAQVGDVEIARMYLDAGADPGIGRDDGTTAASLARAGGHDTVLELLQGAAEAGSSLEPTARSRHRRQSRRSGSG
jgi:ankyrin repeat protein